ncbi:L-lysine 6-monooxygenase (NADPH) [Xylanimonas cellulosilytica DSM 15894]|uniref:L-lysine N6-monooxygenase MbtG n=1 Tax=Xylanimonas cellulosilytica (strain DSM 15894 / JCM 12276 / CECT 5975 / KCTC 9989 / LMG 20990 / NBRC 107835 / XIL07) TaxID=446471 RepID=D1BSY0_XYLCX|nr:SidA/IucD/PvdA family monooxygenase [Xylanimonas cellulosilytica]ACZ30822.1 L-lysine 6-monooxygenase (NADPH) [Xylanimonas cellulosilytica DSM 15894]
MSAHRMDGAHVHDVVGIGLGPFGLGLAALAHPLPDVDGVFLDQRPGFSWHPGMMLDGATIQVPFLADLVTMADPTSPYSFLAFLKATGRLYPFYVRESFYPLRAEYDAYCRWVAGRLPSLRWNRRVVAVERDADRDAFAVHAEVLADGAVVATETHLGRHVALATGTSPTLPPALRALAEDATSDSAAAADATAADATARVAAGPVLHTADYLHHRDALRAARSVTVVGSGQSAAEVYRDLLDDVEVRGARLDWLTRSPRFFPMEYTKLSLELTSPEYTDHYRSLPGALRRVLGREQRALFKGISAQLVDDIHETLYRKSALGRPVPTTLVPDAEVVAARHDHATGEHVLTLRHATLGRTWEHRTRAVVAATGYRAAVPAFLDPVADVVRVDEHGLDVARDYAVDDAGRVHVLGTEEHTHGVTAPDLGFGPWRASVVLAAVTGREPYPIERATTFQTFGVPGTPADAVHAGAAPAEPAHDDAVRDHDDETSLAVTR